MGTVLGSRVQGVCIPLMESDWHYLEHPFEF